MIYQTKLTDPLNPKNLQNCELGIKLLSKSEIKFFVDTFLGTPCRLKIFSLISKLPFVFQNGHEFGAFWGCQFYEE